MLHRKLLLRRLAYVPWLLAVGLVLGWSGEAAADAPETDGSEPNHSGVSGHSHATDPYLSVSYKMGPADSDTVFVNWSASYAKNFQGANGTAATSYTVNLYPGEIPADITDTGISGLTATATGTERTAETVSIHSDILVADLEAETTGPGFYWVRMAVKVSDVDEGSGEQTELFAKQIAVMPDYMLSVSPTSVREDADPTNIAVKVTANAAVTTDTSVPLRLATNQQGLNSRFRIDTPTLTIRENNKEATGTIRFVPIESTTTPDDDILVTVRTTGAPTADGSADIRLVDADKGIPI